MVRKDSLHGEQSLCEYVPSGTLAFGGVGKRMMSEHVLSDKMTGSVACSPGRLHRTIIWILKTSGTPLVFLVYKKFLQLDICAIPFL